MEEILATLGVSSPPIALLVVAIAPAVVLLSYLYMRDRYEKEPLGLIAKAFVFGCLSVIPVIVVELQLTQFNPFSGLMSTAYDAFVVAGLTEEAFKLLAVYLAIYRSPHFNEPYDGVIYAASASLGFATIENISYVLNHGLGTGINRAILAVPGHALWGIAMGFYMGSAKFAPAHKRPRLWMLAFAIPVILHGSYDLIAYNMNTVFSILMYPLVAYLWVTGLRQIERASAASPFRLFAALDRQVQRPLMAADGGASPFAVLPNAAHRDALALAEDDQIEDDHPDISEQDLFSTPPRSLDRKPGEQEVQPCPACHEKAHVGAEVCIHCSLPLAVCHFCHTLVPAATKFCSRCGGAIH